MTFKDTEFGTQCMPNLTWSHIRRIIRLTDKNAMQYYLTKTAANNWPVRTLDRPNVELYKMQEFNHNEPSVRLHGQTRAFRATLIYMLSVLVCVCS
jgi:predicted nuclease of restriction endonuclease-like (RecB) superfamily